MRLTSFVFYWNFSTTTGCNVVKFSADIHDAQRKKKGHQWRQQVIVFTYRTINWRNLCPSVLRLSRQPFIRSTLHLAGVLLRTQGSAVSVWSCLDEWCKQQYRRPSNRPVPNRHVLNGHISILSLALWVWPFWAFCSKHCCAKVQPHRALSVALSLVSAPSPLRTTDAFECF